MNTIDLPRLRADLRATARALGEVKRMLRTRWTEPMAEPQRRLCRLRRRATELCVLRAHLRGRLHCTHQPDVTPSPASPPWDRVIWHAQVASRVARDYVLSPGDEQAAP
jgi:hypothetical protein